MNIKETTRALTTIWELPSPPQEMWLALGWRPLQEWLEADVETRPCVILRPHALWGPMAMIFREEKWLRADHSGSYPAEAFEAYWRPVPQMPRRER